MIKMIDATFIQDKNNFLSYKNINPACFRMLNNLVPNQFKVSNTPMLTGWNATTSIKVILTQMEDLYGKPLAAVLFANDTLFKSLFHPTEAPKLLCYRIEQCQEIMTLGKLSYTTEQVISNTLRLLMTLQIFPLREFNMWESTTIKTYPALKTFIHEAHSCCLNLMKLRNTSSSLGYTMPAHTMYHVLDIGKDDNYDITVATVAAAAVAMTTSLLGQGTAASSLHPGLITAINQSITPAFNQVVQNQTILQHQIAALSMAQPLWTQAPVHLYIVPPILHVAFPMQQPFQAHMQQQQYHQINGFGCGQRGQFQGGRGGQGSQGRGRAFFCSQDLHPEWSRTNGSVPMP
jgi:hypothetical protein